MYKVITHFHDLQDVEKKTKDGPIYHEYNEGDTYPRDGYTPSEERIEELSGVDNSFHAPIIASDEPGTVNNNEDEPGAGNEDTPTADQAEVEEPGGKKASK